MNSFKTKLKESRNKNRLAKRNYEKKLCNHIKNDSESFYAYVRSKQRTKDKVGPLKNGLGEVIADDEGAANLFDDYFSSVFMVERL